MECGWHQTINNTVCYYQTPYDIALILEQVSNYNILLREKIEMEKDTSTKQNNMISDENSYASKLCATANEHAPKRLEEKSEEIASKVNYDAWIKPKKCVPITHFFQKMHQ